MRTVTALFVFALVATAQTTNVVQNDTASTAVNCGTCNSTICSTASIDSPRQMAEGGAAGSVEATENHPAATNDRMIAFFEDPTGIGKSCDTGTVTTRLNVTTANTNLTITEICACQGTTELGAATGLSISLSAGVKTQTVSITSDAGCSSNPVRVIYCGNIGGLHGGEAYGFTPDQSHTFPTPASTRNRVVMIQ